MVFWIVPPVQVGVATVQAPPLSVTSRPPEPVLFNTMPLAGSAAAVLLPAEMLSKMRLLAPMVVLSTLSAVAEVLSMVLCEPVTVTIPPPVALKITVPELLTISIRVQDVVHVRLPLKAAGPGVVVL